MFHKQVLQDTTDNPNPRRIKLSMKLTKEPALQSIKQAHTKSKTRYMPGGFAAQRLGINRHLFSRITGSICVMRTSDNSLEVSKHNIGLNLKFNKPNKEVKKILYKLRFLEVISHILLNFYLHMYLFTCMCICT